MPRQPRYFIPDIPQHVITRGVDKQAVFFQHGDYSLYMSALHKASTEHECDIHAYVLMVNHVHLLVTPRRDRSLPLMMQSMGRGYVQRLNARYGRTGPLWQGRYKACLIQDDKYFLTCQRYIELNPVRAGIAAFPVEYPYSSYAHHALGTEDPLISQHPCYRSLHTDPELRREAYRSLFNDEFSEEELLIIRRRATACSFFGNDRFKKQIEDMLGRSVATGKRGRPAKRKGK
jgi:putative transposase